MCKMYYILRRKYSTGCAKDTDTFEFKLVVEHCNNFTKAVLNFPWVLYKAD